MYVLASFSEVIPSKWGMVMDRLIVLTRKFSDTLTHVQSFIWRVLELHIVKIVAFFVVWVALLEVCTRFISCWCYFTCFSALHLFLSVLLRGDNVSVFYLLWFSSFTHSRLQWTWCWWFYGASPCRTPASDPWPRVSPLSGFVSSSSARCCISSAWSTPQNTPTTAPGWDGKLKLGLSRN